MHLCLCSDFRLKSPRPSSLDAVACPLPGSGCTSCDAKCEPSMPPGSWVSPHHLSEQSSSQETHHTHVPSQVAPNSTAGLWEIHIHFSPPTNLDRSPDPASPPPFLLPATLPVPETLGQVECKPSSKQCPELWEHPPALCVDQLTRKMRPTGNSFNQGHHQSLGNGRPSGGPNPSTDPACCPPLGDQWRAIWPSLLPSAGNREGSNEL